MNKSRKFVARFHPLAVGIWTLGLVVTSALGSFSVVAAGDWPTYRHGIARLG